MRGAGDNATQIQVQLRFRASLMMFAAYFGAFVGTVIGRVSLAIVGDVPIG